MAKIYVGNVIDFELDCKETVDAQPDLWILYEKPVSGAIGRWPAVGVGTLATYTSIKDIDIDEDGTWIVQPWSDTFDVHGDAVEMQIFPPLIPFKTGSKSAYLVGV